MMVVVFVYLYVVYCELGVMLLLLCYYGLLVFEVMVFGFVFVVVFVYLFCICINGLLFVVYCMLLRVIVRGLDRKLGLGMRYERFRSPAAGMARLDALLDAGELVGL